MHSGFRTILGRVVTIFAVLLGTGIVLRLLMLVLNPILPSGLMQILTTGWTVLFSLVQPALGPLVAIAILGAIAWVFIGRHR
jgi:hypothetical protein